MARRKGGGTRKSLKAPAWYDGMRRHGFSKEKAARISNWMKKVGHAGRSAAARRAARRRKKG